MNRPQRRFYLEVQVGADDRPALIAYIQELLEKLKTGVSQSVSGGCDFGGNFTLTENPEMTHDKYFELIDAWSAHKSD